MFNGVWGSSNSDVFAVGDGGTILHYDGSTWTTMNSGTNYSLTGVWGSTSSDVFAVGFVFWHIGGAGTIVLLDLLWPYASWGKPRL